MRRRRGRLVAPAAGSGVLLALSLPPFGWWPLAFAGAALLYWRLEGLRLRSRVLVGWVAGLGCYVPGLFWARSFNWYGAAVLMALEALALAAAAALTPPGRGWGRVAAFVGACTLLEAVRFTWPFGGLPIGGVYLGQAGGPWLGTARLGGPLLLTAVVWAGGAGVATAAAGMRQAAGRTGGRTGGRRLVVGGRRVVVGGLALLVGLGALAVIGGVAPDGGPAVRTIAVASVQGGGRRGLSKEQVDPATVYAAQLDATAADAGRARSSRVSLVVWPEDTVALGQPLVGSPQAAALSALARRWRVTLLAGVTVTLPWPSHTFRNEVVAWGPDGRIVGVFEKVHRVPFGEYVPDRAFFSHLANLSGVPLDAVPGHGSGLLRTPAGPLGLMVSYEVFYAARGRSSVRAGAQLLVVPTNTSSYATSQVPTQEVAAARVQAVSEGRDLVQAAPTGFSALVDHRGRVLERSSLGARQVLLGTVALRDGSTFYERTGDLPVLVLAMVAVAAGWLAEARRNRGRRPAGRPRAEGPAPAHS